jgi:four helix bundle protein
LKPVSTFYENSKIEYRTRNNECRKIIEYLILKHVLMYMGKCLLDFAVRIIRTSESLPKTKAGNHIAGQLIRCDTSPAPNYGEAQSAESRSDFIHKMKVSLKELRETRIWLLMIVKANLIKPTSKLEPLINENNELISIFVTSVKTAKQKEDKKTS